MTRLITELDVHHYAPELNKLHLRNRQTLPAPGITTIKEAKAPLFGRGQPGHQVTITVIHSNSIGAISKPDLPEHLTKLRQHHSVPGPHINIQIRHS
ncbi:TPA: hypothetical protein SIA35_004008 [Aeromonas sobria]|nr:hypothetical protein [Aeromonas sobria]